MPVRLVRLAVFAALFGLLASGGEGYDNALTLHQQPELQNTKTTNWPSLRLLFTLKCSSMNVYGQSKFSMLATPVVSTDGARVLYNVLAQFEQDTSFYNYTEVDGSAYLSISSTANNSTSSSVQCTDPLGDIPSINSIISAINAATTVSTVSGSAGGDFECSSGSLFKVSVSGIKFALCASSSSGFTMHNNDMDISIAYLEARAGIEKPTFDGDRCKTTSISSVVTEIGQSLLTGQPIPPVASRNLEAAFDFSLDDSCSCKSKPRPCVFVHGLGIKKDLGRNRDRFYYWGNVEGHAPCCTSIQYTYLNTSGNPWTSDTLQQKVCDRVMAVSDTSSDSKIRDTIVVAHSMGNLMLAGAIATGKCSLDSTSTWVGLAGPMKGSMCSDFIQESCAGETTPLLETVADVTGKCPPTAGLKSLPYQGQNHSSAALDKAYEAAQKVYRDNVYAVMCSESSSGLLSVYQSAFWLLGKTVPHKTTQNDGMVEFDSCAGGFPESKFGDSYRDRFYRTKLNHFDMGFVSGDAVLDDSKMPVKWFECLL